MKTQTSHLLYKNTEATPANVVYKSFDFELKSVDADKGTFEGLGSVFGNVDQGGDIVMPGAFTKSLVEREVSMLWQHEHDNPIGVYTDIKETAAGLEVKGTLALGVQQANEAHILMKAGALKGLSIGYMINDGEWNKERGAFEIKELELYEVSLVTFPMNELATVGTVKNASIVELLKGGGIPSKRMVEKALRDVGFSKSQSMAFTAKGYTGLVPDDRDDYQDDSEMFDALKKLENIMKR